MRFKARLGELWIMLCIESPCGTYQAAVGLKCPQAKPIILTNRTSTFATGSHSAKLYLVAVSNAGQADALRRRGPAFRSHPAEAVGHAV